MGETNRWKGVMKKAVIVILAVSAAITLLMLAFHGAPGRNAGLSLDDNQAYPLPGPDAGAVETVNSAALVENAKAWNDRQIQFSGEAIGERMIRGEMAWIHLNEDSYQGKNLEEGGGFSGYNGGQAVWLSARDALRLTVFGDYNHGGDGVTVTGVFHAACREHGGDMDIHATSVSAVTPGHQVTHAFNGGNAIIAVVLCLAAAGLYFLRRITARK
jgi:hypothetical protein